MKITTLWTFLAVSTNFFFLISLLQRNFLTIVKRSDDNFLTCLECFDIFLAANMKTWTGALSEDRMPKPKDLAREMGAECRPACGCKMISDEKIESICEYE